VRRQLERTAVRRRTGAQELDRSGRRTPGSEITLYGEGAQFFRHNTIPLAGGDTAELRFGTWTNPSQRISLVTPHNGHPSTQMRTEQQAGEGHHRSGYEAEPADRRYVCVRQAGCGVSPTRDWISSSSFAT
jgi:hypothetical protein